MAAFPHPNNISSPHPPYQPIAPIAPDPRRWLGLLALSISVLTVIMTSTSINLALPAIGGAFGISVSNLTWVIDAYSLALGALTGGPEHSEPHPELHFEALSGLTPAAHPAAEGRLALRTTRPTER